MTLRARLAKLEVVLDVGNDLAALTDDELTMALLDVSRAMLADPECPAEDRARAAATIAEVEESIRAQARARQTPEYAKHLEQVAKASRFGADYVPAVTHLDGRLGAVHIDMAEYADLRRPRIMERRRAILARPDVRALIAEGEAQGPAEPWQASRPTPVATREVSHA